MDASSMENSMKFVSSQFRYYTWSEEFFPVRTHIPQEPIANWNCPKILSIIGQKIALSTLTPYFIKGVQKKPNLIKLTFVTFRGEYPKPKFILENKTNKTWQKNLYYVAFKASKRSETRP